VAAAPAAVAAAEGAAAAAGADLVDRRLPGGRDAVHCNPMSTRPPAQQVPPPSAALRIFVPAYLLLIGLVLIGGFVYLLQNYGDELFVAILALLGGVTMWLTALLMVTVGRRG
jgi:hypothetical protein